MNCSGTCMAAHLNNKTIYGMLEQYRIGNLRQKDVESIKKKEMSTAHDPWANAPKR